jgi:hypothetical protein
MDPKLYIERLEAKRNKFIPFTPDTIININDNRFKIKELESELKGLSFALKLFRQTSLYKNSVGSKFGIKTEKGAVERTANTARIELYELELENEIERLQLRINALNEALDKKGWKIRNPDHYHFNLDKFSSDLDRLGLSFHKLKNEYNIDKNFQYTGSNKEIFIAKRFLALGINIRELKMFYIDLNTKKLNEEQNIAETSRYFTTLFNIDLYSKRPAMFSEKSLRLVKFPCGYFNNLIRDFPYRNSSRSIPSNFSYISTLFVFEDKLSAAFGKEVHIEDYFAYSESKLKV